LADIKAISIPAKKPISSREAKMAIRAIQSIHKNKKEFLNGVIA
jgi:hypothetical protein